MNIRTSRSPRQAAPARADEGKAAVFTAVLEIGQSNIVSTGEVLHWVRASSPSCTLSDEEIVALVVQAASHRPNVVCFDHRDKGGSRTLQSALKRDCPWDVRLETAKGW